MSDPVVDIQTLDELARSHGRRKTRAAVASFCQRAPQIVSLLAVNLRRVAQDREPSQRLAGLAEYTRELAHLADQVTALPLADLLHQLGKALSGGDLAEVQDLLDEVGAGLEEVLVMLGDFGQIGRPSGQFEWRQRAVG